MEIKKEYVAPLLTVVKIKVERGYAASLYTNLSLWDVSFFSSNQVEAYTQHDTWTSDGGFWI